MFADKHSCKRQSHVEVRKEMTLEELISHCIKKIAHQEELAVALSKEKRPKASGAGGVATSARNPELRNSLDGVVFDVFIALWLQLRLLLAAAPGAPSLTIGSLFGLGLDAKLFPHEFPARPVSVTNFKTQKMAKAVNGASAPVKAHKNHRTLADISSENKVLLSGNNNPGSEVLGVVRLAAQASGPNMA